MIRIDKESLFGLQLLPGHLLRLDNTQLPYLSNVYIGLLPLGLWNQTLDSIGDVSHCNCTRYLFLIYQFDLTECVLNPEIISKRSNPFYCAPTIPIITPCNPDTNQLHEYIWIDAPIPSYIRHRCWWWVTVIGARQVQLYPLPPNVVFQV